MKLSEYAKKLGVKYQTAWGWYRDGKIPGAYQLETGTIIVPDDEDGKEEKVVVYARVSSSENKSNLDSQAKRVSDFCAANGWIINSVVKECASGVNDNRPKLNKILKDKSVTKIVVEHKDRLTRFGFSYIEILFDGEIIVINNAENSEDDIVQDFVSIITSFCARIYGKRRSRRKTEKIIEELNSD